MKLWLVALSVFFCTTSLFAEDGSSKPESIERVLRVINKIQRLAIKQIRHADDQSMLEQKLDGILKAMKTTDELSRAAILCNRLASPMNAEDARYDEAFDRAFWLIVSKLSHTKGPEAAAALEEIKNDTLQDGGRSLSFRELIAAQKKLSLEK